MMNDTTTSVPVKLTTLIYNVKDRDTDAELFRSEIKMPTETAAQWDDVQAWYQAQRKVAGRKLGTKI